MNKTIVSIVIVVVIIASAYFIFKKAPEQTMPVSQTPTTEEKIITYTDAGYSPSPLKINIGDSVVFKNESSQSMWPASAMHPAHKDYPTTGGCLGSTFDACKSIQPGDSWPFRFDIVGDWKYHNHLNPQDFGAIVVE